MESAKDAPLRKFINAATVASELGISEPTARLAIARSGAAVKNKACPCCGTVMRGRWVEARNFARYLLESRELDDYPGYDGSGVIAEEIASMGEEG